jgi:hypothetical protein
MSDIEIIIAVFIKCWYLWLIPLAIGVVASVIEHKTEEKKVKKGVNNKWL